MAVIKLSEISSFGTNFKSQSLINRVNSLGTLNVYKNNSLIQALLISDQKSIDLSLFESDGSFYNASKGKNIKDIKSFKDLGIHAINGNINYLPELAWIDSSCGDRVFTVDTKFNAYDSTQHIVKYDKIYLNNSRQHSLTLDDVILQIDNKKICHFAVSESRSYDSSYGGYPLIFYIINKQGEILEFDTQNYRSKIFANPKSLVWKPTGLDTKEGFVKLIENSYYWGNKEELIYTFGLDNNPAGSSFFLELANLNSLQSNRSTIYSSNIQNKIKLNFGSNINFNNTPLPKFDSASCLDDKEFLIIMTPSINGYLDSSCRDLYWFRLKNSKDEAILLADPYRIAGINRFDNVRNCESPVWIRHIKEQPSSEDIIYLVTGQDEVKKFKLDLKP